MTWSARITRPDGTNPGNDYNACQTCKHGQLNKELPSPSGIGGLVPCNISKMGNNLAPLLTNVDIGADGHMAAGEAILKCHGYDAKDSCG